MGSLASFLQVCQLAAQLQSSGLLADLLLGLALWGQTVAAEIALALRASPFGYALWAMSFSFFTWFLSLSEVKDFGPLRSSREKPGIR